MLFCRPWDWNYVGGSHPLVPLEPHWHSPGSAGRLVAENFPRPSASVATHWWQSRLAADWSAAWRFTLRQLLLGFILPDPMRPGPFLPMPEIAAGTLYGKHLHGWQKPLQRRWERLILIPAPRLWTGDG